MRKPNHKGGMAPPRTSPKTYLKIPHVGSRLATTLIFISLTACANQALENSVETEPVTEQQPARAPDALVSLDRQFRRAYDDAVEHHRDNVIFDSPIITQDLLNMTLIRANGDRLRYKMDKTVYFIMARTSHPVMGVFSIISMSEGARLSSYQLTRLREYKQSVENALVHVDRLPVDEQSRERINEILTATAGYITEVTDTGIATEEGFESFIAPLRPLIRENLRRGALEQLNQFNAQMKLWKSEYPHDEWQNLRVVVMGFHQPRRLYTLKLFFQWLLSEPEYESRVVFAEFQHSIFGEKSGTAQRLAIELATKVDLDRIASQAVFEDETYLANDVMGRAARDIIATWGDSDFRVE